MSPLDMTFMFVIIDLFVAFIPAEMARKKGRSYLHWWIIGLFMPFLSILLIAVMNDLRAVPKRNDNPSGDSFSSQGVPTYSVPIADANLSHYMSAFIFEDGIEPIGLECDGEILKLTNSYIPRVGDPDIKQDILDLKAALKTRNKYAPSKVYYIRTGEA